MSRMVIAGLDTIARELGCSKKTLYKWIREKAFPAFKMDGVWRVLPRDVEAWLSEQRHRTIPAAHEYSPLTGRPDARPAAYPETATNDRVR